MNLKDIKKQLPDSPGVYFFLGRNQEILYVGRATSLRDRVRSYFSKDVIFSRSKMIEKMVEKAVEIDHKKTSSVLEAIILEADLIKKYRPAFNIKEKDDKSFNFLVITREKFPRILVVRGKELKEKYKARGIKYQFGPFPQGGILKDALKIIRKIFPFRDRCVPYEDFKDKSKASPCFHCQIGLCPGVCTGEISQREYQGNVRAIAFLFKGKKKMLLKELEKEMKKSAKEENFEKAAEIKKTILALKHIADISLMKREETQKKSQKIEGYDISHLSGQEAVGAMTVLEKSVPNKKEYRKFKIRFAEPGDDAGCLREVLLRRFKHKEWKFPDLVVVDGGEIQRKAAITSLKKIGLKIPVAAVVKDRRHKPREIRGPEVIRKNFRNEILLVNNESHRFALNFQKSRRKKLK